VLLELPGDSTRALLLTTLATGLGSNPVGLDRGANGGDYVVRFDRSGERVLAVLENWQYRSSDTANRAHQRTVAEAFPPSTVAALPLVASEGGRLLVDATDFVVRDWMDVPRTLERTGQGSYAVARDRSGLNRALTRNFPRNTEIDVTLTFAASGRPGPIVERITPDGRAFTLREHLSLIPLPDGQFRPRELDARVGYFGIRFHDFAQPIQRPLQQGLGVAPSPGARGRRPHRQPDRVLRRSRHSGAGEDGDDGGREVVGGGVRQGGAAGRLPRRVAAGRRRSDGRALQRRAVGEPQRARLVDRRLARRPAHRRDPEGDGAHGQPSRAHRLQPVRGPDGRRRGGRRHRVRARARAAGERARGRAHARAGPQLHRLDVRARLGDGLPAPRVRLSPAGEIDIAQAYDVGPGEYDVWAIRWGYGTFPPASEADSLRAIVQEGLRQSFLYLADADARPEYASDPRTNLWDDAGTAEEFWRHQTGVRRVAMSRFGERVVRPGDPLALLHERFAPVYFMHRFALTSLSKAVGGMEYASAMRGDGQQVTRAVPVDRQRKALQLLVDGLQPRELAIPDTVRALLGPNAETVTPGVELFRSRTRPAFDALGAARTLAQMTVDAVLQRERAARLVQQRAFDPRQLSLAETIDAVAAGTRWPGAKGASAAGGSSRDEALRFVGQRALLDRLITLAADSDAAPEVRAMAELKLGELGAAAGRQARAASGIEARAHHRALALDAERWLTHREAPRPSPALVAPPGDPFGEPADWP
jgi:hypothetical protein